MNNNQIRNLILSIEDESSTSFSQVEAYQHEHQIQQNSNLSQLPSNQNQNAPNLHLHQSRINNNYVLNQASQEISESVSDLSNNVAQIYHSSKENFERNEIRITQIETCISQLQEQKNHLETAVSNKIALLLDNTQTNQEKCSQSKLVFQEKFDFLSKQLEKCQNSIICQENLIDKQNKDYSQLQSNFSQLQKNQEKLKQEINHFSLKIESQNLLIIQQEIQLKESICKIDKLEYENLALKQNHKSINSKAIEAQPSNFTEARLFDLLTECIKSQQKANEIHNNNSSPSLSHQLNQLNNSINIINEKCSSLKNQTSIQQRQVFQDSSLETNQSKISNSHLKNNQYQRNQTKKHNQRLHYENQQLQNRYQKFSPSYKKQSQPMSPKQMQDISLTKPYYNQSSHNKFYQSQKKNQHEQIQYTPRLSNQTQPKQQNTQHQSKQSCNQIQCSPKQISQNEIPKKLDIKSQSYSPSQMIDSQYPINQSSSIEIKAIAESNAPSQSEDTNRAFLCGCNPKSPFKNLDSLRTHIYSKHKGKVPQNTSHDLKGNIIIQAENSKQSFLNQ